MADTTPKVLTAQTVYTTARDEAARLRLERTVTLPEKYNNLYKYEERKANLQARVTDYDAEITALQTQLDAGIEDGSISNQEIVSLNAQIASMKANRASVTDPYNDFLNQYSAEKTQAAYAASLAIEAAAALVKQAPVKNTKNAATGDLKYNASSVNEAYFGDYHNRLPNRLMPNVNKPTAVSAASELWTSAAGSKGMIVTSEQVLKGWSGGGNAQSGGNYFDKSNYGFQFQYNPGTVAMSYFTSPNVDVAMMTSGTEMFNLAGVSGSQGSVSFQIIINRIFDMQYLNSNGILQPGAINNYSKPPAIGEDTEIYNKGTMYDVEYLLRTLMGTTMNSYLRGERTADMGWLPAIPVELHLGKSLRYLGTVNSLSLNHIIFNERMVPLFSTLDIAFARLPDYPPNTGGGGTNSGVDLGSGA